MGWDKARIVFWAQHGCLRLRTHVWRLRVWLYGYCEVWSRFVNACVGGFACGFGFADVHLYVSARYAEPSCGKTEASRNIRCRLLVDAERAALQGLSATERHAFGGGVNHADHFRHPHVGPPYVETQNCGCLQLVVCQHLRVVVHTLVCIPCFAFIRGTNARAGREPFRAHLQHGEWADPKGGCAAVARL